MIDGFGRYKCTSTNAFTRSSPCYCTISCIYGAACAATAVAVCRTIIKRPLGVLSSPLRTASQPASQLCTATKFGSLPKQEITPNKGTHVLAADRMCLLWLWLCYWPDPMPDASRLLPVCQLQSTVHSPLGGASVLHKHCESHNLKPDGRQISRISQGNRRWNLWARVWCIANITLKTTHYPWWVF